MSRALSDDVKKAIKHGDHEKTFENIAGVLSQQLPELLEIEFLGRSHIIDADTIFLQDGAAVAIPKIRLVQAFIFARKIFLEYLAGKWKGNHDAVLKATAVMLLMDPEHLTAANMRKRLLLDIIQGVTNIEESIQNEKYFIDSLLTSRLHRHTKSPTIWNHRQWLMERFRDHGLGIDALETMKTVVFVAAERHPRNYYAWCHARYLISLINPGSQEQQQQQLPAILDASKRWCFSHHDDVSGWAFLMYFLNRYPEHTAPVLGETLGLASSLHWRNESVWYFLRNMMRQPSVDEHGQEAAFHTVRLALMNGTEEGSMEKRVLGQALSWVETHSTT